MSDTGRIVAKRGAPGSWITVGHREEGPSGSGLSAKRYVSNTSERSDIEESVDGVKRRIHSIVGEHAHARAVAWMLGFTAGRNYVKPKIVLHAPSKKRKVCLT